MIPVYVWDSRDIIIMMTNGNSRLPNGYPIARGDSYHIGYEVGLELVEETGCCCVSTLWKHNCNILRVSYYPGVHVYVFM